MSKGGFFLDMKEFERGVKKITEQTIPDAAEKGIYDAANEMLHDAITKPPQAPKDMGDLWGSRIVEKPKKAMGGISVTAGFNIRYAHRHHEVPPGTYKYTVTKGATQPGPKYLESKMIKYKDKYAWIVAETIKRSGK